MRLKLIGAAVVALLAAATLSACQTNVGLAARVGGHEISESRLNSYLLPGGSDENAVKALTAIVSKQGQTLGELPAPRPFALHFLIEEQLLDNCLSALGKTPSASQLTRAQAEAAQSGGSTDRVARLIARAVGLRGEVGTVYQRVTVLEGLLNKQVGATTSAQFYGYVSKHGGSVRLNPRYGTWDATTLTVTTSGSAGLPGFLTLQPTAASGS